MKAGLIKVSVLYPNGKDKNFNMDYYCTTHLPMVGKLIGDALVGAAVEKGLAGGAPGSQPSFVAMGNMYFNSIEDFENSFGPNAEKIMGDLPNFTNIEPIIQISEVMV